MFIDKIKIKIKAGNGGDGAVSFYTEKYVPNGGPDGGDGGPGGDIIFTADERKTNLSEFSFSKAFKAEDGERGGSKYCHGKSGKNLVIGLPQGTVIRDAETGGILADLFSADSSVTVLKGGYGGKGNARFKSSRRQAPTFAQSGVKTQQREVVLELKTIADVGLIGFPNVGKSTLISVISAARPKIANYHFTTLSPVLGVVQYYEHFFTVADIPGLIEGASSGAGLGFEFLRHIERTRLLVHLVDISGSEGRDPVQDYRTIRAELNGYCEKLSEIPEIVVLNKCDLLQDKSQIKQFEKAVKVKPLQIVGAIAEGTEQLIAEIYKKLQTLPPPRPLEFEPFEYAPRDISGYDIIKTGEGEFEILGGLVDELARNVLLDNPDSMRYFQRKLKGEGVFKALRKAGAKEGDTVRMMDIEFDFLE
ncbi:MAG: GTPase ObgE [Firmicutes bacterium]|nr:GTPase ObgE [Bacillota bacterium]